MPDKMEQRKKPNWLRKRLPKGQAFETVKDFIKKNGLHTICQEARCPNIWECFSRRTATFLIMGPLCTRNCRFCAVSQGSEPFFLDSEEPARLANAVLSMKLDYVVVTSVTRDDLPDGGANFFAKTIKEIRKKRPAALIEVLIPDFQGKIDALKTIVKASPDVLNHNIETVPRLYSSVRPLAVYRRSLELLEQVKILDPDMITKSGLMLGLGESSEEILQTLYDIFDAGCRILTLGQYLQPTRKNLPVKRFVPPEEFESWRKTALEIGFIQVASAPFVRSSYHAKELYLSKMQRK